MTAPLAYNDAGGVFMCRRELLWGSVVIAFGMGVLTGTWLSSGVVAHLIGLGLILFGFALLRRH